MKADSTKARIFVVARDLFDSEGGAGVSMRKIAEVVGITPMAIYRHYADKDAVLDALMLDGMAAWETRVKSIGTKEPLVWLEKFGIAFLEFSLAEPRRYEAAFLLEASAARRYPPDFAHGRSPVLSMVYARIEQARKEGAIGSAPALEIGLALSALAQGLVTMYRAGRFISEAEFRTSYRKMMRNCLRSYTNGAWK